MNLKKSLKTIVWSLLALLILLFLITKVIEYDVWLHLSSGKYILDNFKVPGLDPFSYTAAHREYVDSHWLYQVLLYIFYNTMGYFGLFLYQFLVIGAIFYILFSVGKKSNFFATTACILLTLIIGNYRFLYRPEMFSYLFAVLFILILENRKKLYLLPIIQIFWTNTHGFFIFGPVIIGCYFIGELIHKKQIAKPILLSGILCILACFINPYGYKLVAYPFLLLTEIGSKASPYMKSVTELTPTLFTEKGNYRFFAYIFLILISAVSFGITKKISFSRLFVCAVFLYLSWITERNTVFFAFVGFLITILNFREIKEISISQKIQQVSEIIYPAVIIILAVIISIGIITNRYYRQERTTQQFGLGKVDILFPSGAIEFIKKNNIQGNIFNDALIGGYFIWNCWPERKCFVDGKMEIYGEKFLSDYKNVIDNPDAFWQKLAEKYKIDYALLHPLSPHSINVMKYLYKNKNWQLVFFDESGIVFVKKQVDKSTPTRRGEFICPYNVKQEIKELNLENYSKLSKILATLSYANFYFFTEQYQKAQPLYAEVLKLDPDFTEAYINLGAIFITEKKYSDANACYYRALQLSRKYAEPYFGLAILEVERKNYEMAQFFLGEALRIKPIYPEAQFLLGYIYLGTKNYGGAINLCKEMLLRNPVDEKIYNMLGASYFQKGDYENALKQFKKATEINPDYTEAKRNLAGCLDKMKE